MHHRNAEHLIWMYDIYLLASTLSDTDFDRFVEIASVKKVGAVCAHELARARAVRRSVFHLQCLAVLAERGGGPRPAAYLRPSRRWVDELASSWCGLPRWGDRVGLLREIAFPSPCIHVGGLRRALRDRSSRPDPAGAVLMHRILKGIRRSPAEGNKECGLVPPAITTYCSESRTTRQKRDSTPWFEGGPGPGTAIRAGSASHECLIPQVSMVPAAPSSSQDSTQKIGVPLFRPFRSRAHPCWLTRRDDHDIYDPRWDNDPRDRD